MCWLFFPWANDEITFPKELKLRFIVLSSNKCYWSMCSSFAIFSLPAKSHKFNFPLLSIPRWSALSDSIKSWKIVWDLEEWMLDLVCLVILFFSPLLSKMKQSWALVTTYSLSPSMKIPENLSSLMNSGFLALKQIKELFIVDLKERTVDCEVLVTIQTFFFHLREYLLYRPGDQPKLFLVHQKRVHAGV